MPLTITCPLCHHASVPSDSLWGRTVRCSHCKGVFRMPDGPSSAPVQTVPVSVVHLAPVTVVSPRRFRWWPFQARYFIPAFVVGAVVAVALWVFSEKPFPSSALSSEVPFVSVMDLCKHPDLYVGQFIETNLWMSGPASDRVGTWFLAGAAGNGDIYMVSCNFIPSSERVAFRVPKGTTMVVQGRVAPESANLTFRDHTGGAVMRDCVLLRLLEN